MASQHYSNVWISALEGNSSNITSLVLVSTSNILHDYLWHRNLKSNQNKPCIFFDTGTEMLVIAFLYYAEEAFLK